MRGPFEGEFSANLWASGIYSGDSIELDEQLSPYRMWVKFSGDQFELRAGLQKVNFGSAQMFRPLMWFDRIDPRDPLQLTDGAGAHFGSAWSANQRIYFTSRQNGAENVWSVRPLTVRTMDQLSAWADDTGSAPTSVVPVAAEPGNSDQGG